MKKLLCTSAVFLTILFMGQVKNVQAQQISLPQFSKSVSYDVYFSSGEESSVISDVEILGLEDIAGVQFLRVKPSEFTLGNSDGYILFSAVQAILPNRKVKFKENRSKRINFR